MMPLGIRLAALKKAYGNTCAKLPGYKIPFSLGVIIGPGCFLIVMQKKVSICRPAFCTMTTLLDASAIAVLLTCAGEL